MPLDLFVVTISTTKAILIFYLLIAFEDGLDPITYGEHYFALAEELELLLKRPVDLLTEASLKNPFFIRSINKTKELIYA